VPPNEPLYIASLPAAKAKAWTTRMGFENCLTALLPNERSQKWVGGKYAFTHGHDPREQPHAKITAETGPVEASRKSLYLVERQANRSFKNSPRSLE
jgi:hypothetical protein